MGHFSLLVGLGNPGPEYEQTRHNAGFWFVEEIARQQNSSFLWHDRFGGWIAKCELNGVSFHLLKPGKFMNLSGIPVAAFCRYYKLAPEKLLVAHDELDFQPGVVKFKRGGGHGGHNGVRSIIENLGSRDFARIRIGIGRPNKGSVTSYVLGKPSAQERQKIDEAIQRSVACLPTLLHEGLEKAMALLHQSLA